MPRRQKVLSTLLEERSWTLADSRQEPFCFLAVGSPVCLLPFWPRLELGLCQVAAADSAEDCVVAGMASIPVAPLVVDGDRRGLAVASLAVAETCSFAREAMCMYPLPVAVARAKPCLSRE